MLELINKNEYEKNNYFICVPIWGIRLWLLSRKTSL